MYCGCVLLGSLAAFLASFCVFCPSSAAVGSTEGSIIATTYNAQTRTIGIPNVLLSDESERRISGTTVSGRIASRPYLRGIDVAGTTVPTDNASGDQDTTSGADQATPEGTNTTPAEPADGDFTGSASPEGPDLTPTEESGLISGGWK